MEELYLIFKSFVDPVFIVSVLLVIGFFSCIFGNKKNGALVVFLSFILLYGLSIDPVANYLSYYLEKDYISKTAEKDKNIDVIVVLGGGAYDINSLENTYPTTSTAARLIYAVEFYNKKGAKYFICSGRGTGKISESEVMAGLAEKLGVPKEKIRMEAKSQNTWEHAVELNKIFTDKNIVLGIVTSAYHLKRSEKEFKKYFKNVVPLPANYLYSSTAGLPALKYFPQTHSLYKTSIALGEIVGQGWYSLKNY